MQDGDRRDSRPAGLGSDPRSWIYAVSGRSVSAKREVVTQFKGMALRSNAGSPNSNNPLSLNNSPRRIRDERHERIHFARVRRARTYLLNRLRYVQILPIQNPIALLQVLQLVGRNPLPLQPHFVQSKHYSRIVVRD